jgi:hypothetical protein
MQISKAVSLKTITFEALAASAMAVGAAALLSPRNIGLVTLFPYPIWLAIALVAARYGTRGLMVGLPVGWGVTAAVSLVLQMPLAVIAARTSSGPDLGALLGVVMIGWVASMHERRSAELGAMVTTLKERCAADHEAVVELRTTAVALRARADRLETSLTFLREVASRLEGTDPVAAAQAALELAMRRIGARAGAVQLIDERGLGGQDTLTTLATEGAWTSSSTDLWSDRTAAAAVRNRHATRAIDLNDAGPEDSDLAAPIFAGKGEHLVGLIALRGVPHGGANTSALHDLTLVAGWCARSLSRDRQSQGLPEDRDDPRLGSDSSLSSLREAPDRSVSQLNL